MNSSHKEKKKKKKMENYQVENSKNYLTVLDIYVASYFWNENGVVRFSSEIKHFKSKVGAMHYLAKVSKRHNMFYGFAHPVVVSNNDDIDLVKMFINIGSILRKEVEGHELNCVDLELLEREDNLAHHNAMAKFVDDYYMIENVK